MNVARCLRCGGGNEWIEGGVKATRVSPETLRDMARIVDAAQTLVAAWRISNVYERDWAQRLRNEFNKVPDKRREEFHEVMALLLGDSTWDVPVR